MRTPGKKILDYYEEGRITATGVILDILERGGSGRHAGGDRACCPRNYSEKLGTSSESYRPVCSSFPGRRPARSPWQWPGKCWPNR